MIKKEINDKIQAVVLDLKETEILVIRVEDKEVTHLHEIARAVESVVRGQAQVIVAPKSVEVEAFDLATMLSLGWTRIVQGG